MSNFESHYLFIGIFIGDFSSSFLKKQHEYSLAILYQYILAICITKTNLNLLNIFHDSEK